MGRREGGRKVSGESEEWKLKLYQCDRLGEVEIGDRYEPRHNKKAAAVRSGKMLPIW